MAHRSIPTCVAGTETENEDISPQPSPTVPLYGQTEISNSL